MKQLFSLFLMLAFCIKAGASVVGEWHLYQPQNNISEVEEVVPDSLYFVLTSPTFYLVDVKNGERTSYDRLSGLNGNNVTHIAWSTKAQKLLIAYANSEMDLLSLEGEITYVPDLYNNTLNGDKTITGIYIEDQYAYVTTPLGILCLDMQQEVVKETYPRESEVGRWALSQPQSRNDQSHLPETGEDPEHPIYKHFHFAEFSDGRLYTLPGAYRGVRGWQGNRTGSVQVLNLDDYTWSYFDDRFKDTLSHKFEDLEQLSIDPTDPTHIAVGGRTGLYEYRADTLYRHFSYYNSPLLDAVDTKGDYTIVDGVLFDPEGNLWVTNSHAANKQLHCLKTEGKWITPSFMPEDKEYRALSSMMIDSRNYLWFINEERPEPLVACYDYTNNASQLFTTFKNQNGDYFNADGFRFQCLAEDIEGNIWVGSTKGPFYIKKEQIYSGEQVFYQHIIPRNDGTNLGDYLLSGVHIFHIAVDAAGRKWFATCGNGVYLISADNNTMLEHFTTENSPLPSNDVLYVAIDPASGQVYFCTDEGLASWQSDVTPGAKDFSSLYCYPNPVRPEFSGKLTICGLMAGSTVKIADAAHHVVYSTETQSGTVLWDLTNHNGNRIKPGVYFIIGVDENGEDGAMCKFLVF